MVIIRVGFSGRQWRSVKQQISTFGQLVCLEAPRRFFGGSGGRNAPGKSKLHFAARECTVRL